MFDAEGKNIFRNEGHIKTLYVQPILDYVASVAHMEYEDFQRHIQARADRLREEGVAVNLME